MAKKNETKKTESKPRKLRVKKEKEVKVEKELIVYDDYIDLKGQKYRSFEYSTSSNTLRVNFVQEKKPLVYAKVQKVHWDGLKKTETPLFYYSKYIRDVYKLIN